ncbi:MAG: UDP-N-acetylmuramate--L-alanine ligase [Planctomycetota bacterium]
MKLGSDRFHLVGVGGSGMSALARLLHGIGADVTGSDAVVGEVLHNLGQEGIAAWVGHRPERISGENGYVVRSAAVPATDPEVSECERRGFTSMLYAEAVGRLSEGKCTLAVAGTHGKTTTTALTVSALRAGGLDPSHLVGGEVPELGGNGYGGKDDLLVVEACEFNRSFHHLRPFGAGILNLDHDHFDCYPSTDDLIEAFAGYLAKVRPDGVVFVEEFVPDAVVNSVRKDVRVLRVGSGLFADLRAVEVGDDLGRYSFVPLFEGRRLPRVHLKIPGRFQMHNALFALGLAGTAGADLEGACAGLEDFHGVRRRFEMLRGQNGGRLINDYAHHPAEIRAVIRAARRRFPGKRLVVAFQPHQHQRTLHLLDQFAEVLADADHCLIADIYGAREAREITDRVSATDLVEAIRGQGGRSDLGGQVHELPDRLTELHEQDDLLLVLGAGDIGGVVEDVVARL